MPFVRDLPDTGKSRSLAVIWEGRHVGDLSLDSNGAMHFGYSEQWLLDSLSVPISITLPKRTESFADRECKPFFEGLLPEEWQREAAAQALGISSGNPFRLLEGLGGDVAGALTFETGRPNVPTNLEERQCSALNDVELLCLIDRFVKVPMLGGQGPRYSLAGAQSKLPVILRDNGIALAPRGQPTTHIMKPEPARFPGLAANEAFCLTLARSVGLDGAKAKWRSVGGRAFVLVPRYDRIVENGRTLRLHQEDFAQGLGVLSSKKYASDGGPVFRDCFALLRRATTDPQTEMLKLIDAALFNLIIGNADAHAKNFSLLRTNNGKVILAPLYDLVATVVWPELSSRFAMKYGRAKTLKDMSTGSFERFAADAGVDFELVRARGMSLCERVLEATELGLHIAGLPDSSSLAALSGLVHDRAGRVYLKLGRQG